jgi:hypothetical protein
VREPLPSRQTDGVTALTGLALVYRSNHLKYKRDACAGESNLFHVRAYHRSSNQPAAFALGLSLKENSDESLCCIMTDLALLEQGSTGL